MDTTATDIVFDEHGHCNYCTDFAIKLERVQSKLLAQTNAKEEFIKSIKEQGKGKQYDCIVGVSGGVDSSYVLYLAVQHGLRPLAVHLDNGWNSELASHNIANLVTSLGVDLYTHVINWNENRDLQRSFFKANVVDIEMLMDNAMLALNYRMAAKNKVRFILSGSNSATEGMNMPKGWNHLKFDARNIKAIHQQFGTHPIKTHPLLSTAGFIWYEFVKKIKWISFLDYFDYKKDTAIETLVKECNYKPYPYKHYESVFTRFYQAYILPKKFNIDKRKLHLSTLVISGQLSRSEAIKLLNEPTYSSDELEKQDLKFVLKKMGFSEEEFMDYLRSPNRLHNSYKTEEPLWNGMKKIYKLMY
jgi:N-acetyl sugar amidotransferase